MCDHILYDPAPARKIPDFTPPDLSLQPVYTDLICPRCYREVGFAPAAARVWCFTCGWVHTLTAEEHEALVDALAGITDLNTQVYLQLLAAQDAPATPADNTASSTDPIPLPQVANAGLRPVAVKGVR